MTVKTGPLAQGGIQMEQGIATFLKEKNSTFGSRKVELLVADTGGNPAGAKTKAQELIERDKVDVILGPLAAFELLAITDYVREHQTPMLSLAAAEDVTQRKVNPWVIRPAASSGQCSHVMADYAAKEMGLKRMATISEDFAFGHEQCAAFQRVFEDTGGKIVKKLWPPLVTPDYTPYIAQIGDVDGVFNGFAGSNPVKFMRSYADLGLKAKIPLTAGWTALDDALLKSVGDEAVGVISASYYTADHDSPSNKRFVAAMAKDYGVLPGAIPPPCISPVNASRPRSARPAASRTTRRRSATRCTACRSRTRRAARSPSTRAATSSARCSYAAASARAAVSSTPRSRPTRRSASSGPTRRRSS